MRVEVFPLDIDYIVIEGRPVIRIFGLTQDGDRKILYDNNFRPYCYVMSEKQKLEGVIGSLQFVDGIEEVKKQLLGKELTMSRVFTKLPEDVPKIKQLNLRTFEADIPFYKRYILDKQIGTSIRTTFEVDGDNITGIISSESAAPPLRAVAFDIETFSRRNFSDPKTDPIVAISVVGYDIKKCITWLNAEGDEIVRVKDEAELLREFSRMISESKINTVIGYNSDTFDMPYIYDRARLLGVKMQLNGFDIKIRGEKRKVAEINGTAHIDILNFIRNIYAIYNLKTEVLTLREVANEVLGEAKGEFDWKKVDDIFKSPETAKVLCDYCIQDSNLTFRLYNKLSPLIVEFNKLIGQSISDVSRMTTGAVVEYLVMRRAITSGEVIPNKPSEFEINGRMKRINVGGFVFQPKPGLYENVAVVDFRSLYPSIIVSYNICPSTISVHGGEPTFLDKQERVGLIPKVLSEVIRLRFEAKDRLKLEKKNQELNARVLVLKLIANGFYGYLGYFNSRWYCFECAGSVTSLGRKYVKQVIDDATALGFDVIYADTDSAFLQGSKINDESVRAFLESINKTLPKPMELELQDVYTRAIFVSSKGSEKGAKKKYALCDREGKITIKGFQSVRRDWAIVAKDLQKEVLKRILVSADVKGALDYAKSVVTEVKGGNMDLEKLSIYTRLHKDLESYRQTGRHVSAAERSGMSFSSGDTIKYIIAKGKPGESISSRSVLFDIAKSNRIKYDSTYYIENQIIPSVIQIFKVLGYSESDITGTGSNSLFSFM